MKKFVILILLILIIILVFFNIKGSNNINEIEALRISEIIVDITKNNENFSIYADKLRENGFSENIVEDIKVFYDSLQDDSFLLNYNDISRNIFIRDYDGSISDYPEGSVLELSVVENIKPSEFFSYSNYANEGDIVLVNLSGVESIKERLKNPYFRFSYVNCNIYNEYTVISNLKNGLKNKDLIITLKYNTFKELESVGFKYEYN